MFTLKTTGEYECSCCGRAYDAEDLNDQDHCPSDDCPSNSESQ